MRNAIMVGVSDAKSDLTPGRILEIKKKLNLCNIFAVYGTQECSGAEIFKEKFSFWEMINGNLNEKYMKHAIDDRVLSKSAPYDFEALYLMIREGANRRDFEVRKNIYLKMLKFWNGLVIDEKITDVFFNQIPHESPTYPLYIICKIHNIKMCMGDALSVYDFDFPRKIVLKDIYYDDEWLEKKKSEVALYNDLDLVFSMNKLYDAMQWNVEKKATKTPLNFESRNQLIKKQFAGCGHAKLDFNGLHTPKEYAKKILWWLYHRVYADRRYKDPTKELIEYYNSLSKPADFSKKYVYVPLHYSPECTSNPQGGNIYGEMVIIIDILSEALPDDVLIYVKEHPSQTAFARDRDFYDRCMEIKNVVLIDEDTSIHDLFDNCIAVSTITGTSGYEAQYYGKPFLMFGYYISKYAPGTICVRTVEDCKRAFELIQNHQISWSNQDLKRYLKFVEEVSYSEREISDEAFADYVCNILESE